MSSTTGKCLCGQITVSLPNEVLNKSDGIVTCHCKNCRRFGGSLESINVIAPESVVKITGQPKVYQDGDTDSGNTVPRAFCGNCGCSIYTDSPSMAGLRIFKLGLFDDIPKPSMEIYCKSRPSWHKPIDGAKQIDTMP